MKGILPWPCQTSQITDFYHLKVLFSWHILRTDQWDEFSISNMLFSFLQLPHGLPPTSLNLETDVEKQFLRDPAWLPIHDTDLAFQRFLKYVKLFIIRLVFLVENLWVLTRSCVKHIIVWLLLLKYQYHILKKMQHLLCFHQSVTKEGWCWLSALLHPVSTPLWAFGGQRSNNRDAVGFHRGNITFSSLYAFYSQPCSC